MDNLRFRFRVWDKATKNMIDVVSIYLAVQKVVTDAGIFTLGKNVILMQCTGIKDKNGQLIFEGEIDIKRTLRN